jgi:hypothetical protein
MPVMYAHQFHYVAYIRIGPARTLGEGSEAFTVRDIELYPDDGGEPLKIEVFTNRNCLALPAVLALMEPDDG